MNVMHVLAPGTVGGLERVVQALASGLRARGHDIHVATILDRPSEHPMFAPLRAAGVTVHPLPIPPRAYRQERADIESLFRRIGPDVVHTHGYRADVVDGPIARQLGIPTVSTVHGFTGGGLKNLAYEFLQRVALRRCDAVVAVARSQVAGLGVLPERLQLIPNAWCPDQVPFSRDTARHILGVPPERFHLGWVGRLSWEKGADVFLEAVARLNDLPLAISMIGDGVERRALEEQSRRLGIQPHTTWWGTVRQANRLFPGFDTFVMSSRTEGTPMVLFEAMRAGVPIVATAVGGVPDVITGDEATLVAPRDPAALAAAIRRIYQDRASARTRAIRATGRLDQFSPEPWLDQYDALYQRLGARMPAAVASV